MYQSAEPLFFPFDLSFQSPRPFVLDHQTLTPKSTQKGRINCTCHESSPFARTFAVIKGAISGSLHFTLSRVPETVANSQNLVSKLASSRTARRRRATTGRNTRRTFHFEPLLSLLTVLLLTKSYDRFCGHNASDHCVYATWYQECNVRCNVVLQCAFD